ncbi:MAG TPA: sel1 repeat family protein, partial [bacterium]|nr:sel1 repeat family protein [bacterium]
VSVNREKAARYLLKACDMNAAVGCYQLGKFWLDDKLPLLKNKKAVKYFSKACKLGDLESCRLINAESDGKQGQ